MTTIKLFAAVNMKGNPFVAHASGNRYAIIRWIAERNSLSPGTYQMAMGSVTIEEKAKRPANGSGRRGSLRSATTAR